MRPVLVAILNNLKAMLILKYNFKPSSVNFCLKGFFQENF